MKTGRFHYQVEIEVQFTGLDLTILEYHAKRHYDGTCNRFFEPAQDIRDAGRHQGYGWMRQWEWADWKARFGHLEGKRMEDGECRHPSEAPEQTCTVRVSSCELDLCMKILERLGVADTWALVEHLTGRKMPAIEQKMSQLVVPLRIGLNDAFSKIYAEWKRLDDEAEASLISEEEEP